MLGSASFALQTVARRASSSEHWLGQDVTFAFTNTNTAKDEFSLTSESASDVSTSHLCVVVQSCAFNAKLEKM